MYSQKIDDILTKPYSLWLLSIVIAVGLWVYVIGEQVKAGEEMISSIDCEIEYINVAPQFELKNRVDSVFVNVSGREKDIESFLIEKNLSCIVDVRGLTAGRYRLPVKVILPKEIKFRDTRPSMVIVSLIRYADRLVDVEVVLPQDFPEELYLDSLEIVPKQVTARGIESDLARLSRVKITPTMEELRSSRELELLLHPELERIEPFEDVVKIDPERVKLKAIIASGTPRRKTPVRARISGKPDDDYAIFTITIDPAEIMVEGPKTGLDKLTFLETGTVDITGIKESTSMAVRIKSPQDESLNVVGEGTVKVSVNLLPMTATKEIVNIPVRIEGSEHSNWKTVPSAVTVTIEGLPSNINSPASESLDIEAYVNVENLFSLQAILPVRTRIDSDLFKVTNTSPFTVSVINEP